MGGQSSKRDELKREQQIGKLQKNQKSGSEFKIKDEKMNIKLSSEIEIEDEEKEEILNNESISEIEIKEEEIEKIKLDNKKLSSEIDKKNEENEKIKMDNKNLSLELEKQKEEFKKKEDELKIVKEELYEIKEKEKPIRFPSLDEIKLNDNLDNEMLDLLKRKKDALRTQLNEIKNDLDKIENVYEIEKFRTKKDEQISKNNLKNFYKAKTYCCCKSETYLKFNFKFIGILFVFFDLIGVYQLLWILNSTKQEMKFGFNSFLFSKNRTEYFSKDSEPIKKFENYPFNNLPDFDLMFLSSIIGNFILKCFGYVGSLFFYMFINSGILFLMKFYVFPDIYNFFQLLLVLGAFISLYLAVGSITLFSIQIYFDGLTKYFSLLSKMKNILIDESLENKENYNINSISKDINFESEKKQNNKSISNLSRVSTIKKKFNEQPSFFIYIWCSQIPSYMVNVTINYIIKITDSFSKYYYLDIFIISIIIYIISTLISTLIYCIYSRVFIKNKNSKKNNKSQRDVCRILGFIIYYEEKEQGEKNDDTKNDNLNTNLINNENEDTDANNNSKSQKNICCYTCKLAAKKCLIKYDDTILSILCYCGCLEYLCKFLFFIFCCYREKDELSELNQGNEIFCYFYKIQRALSWFCDLLFKDNVLDLIIYDILNELLTIGFQNKLSKILNENEFNDNFISIILFLVYFLFLLL